MNVINYAYLHLVLVHIPIVGLVFGIFLLVVAMAKKSEEIKRVSLVVFVLIAVMTLPAYFTGEPAEDAVERLPGVAESIIDEHEESSLMALLSAELLGITALGGLLLLPRSKTISTWFLATQLVLSIGSGGLMANTANLGGKIRHTEIRSGLRSPPADDGRLAKTPQALERESKEGRAREDDKEDNDDD